MRANRENYAGLTDEDRQDPEVTNLVGLWKDVELFEAVRADAYVVRDAVLTDITDSAAARKRGLSRGLVTRLTQELDLTKSGMSACKTRTKRRRENDETVPERRARAVLAAVHAAATAYREAMAEESAEDGNTA